MVKARPATWILVAALGLIVWVASTRAAGRTVVDLDEKMEILIRDDIVTIDEVARAEEWVPASEFDRRHGSIWARLEIDEPGDGAGLWLLEVNYAWEIVEVFVRKGDDWTLTRTGRALPVNDLPVRHPRAFVPLNLSEAGVPGGMIFLRFVHPEGGYGSPHAFLERLGPSIPVLESERRQALFDGAFSGVAFAMAIFNLFLYFSLRDRARLWYVLYVVFFGLVWVVDRGILAELVWPSFPGRGYAFDFVFMCGSIVFGTLFARDFLQVAEYAPRFLRMLDVVIVAPMVALVLGALGVWSIAETLTALSALAGFVLFIYVGVVVLRAGFTPARYFLLAWGVLSVGGIPYILAYFGLLPIGDLVRNGPRIAAAAEMLLLALALGYRIRLLERENRVAQERYTRQLEQNVRERTSDLEFANEQLRSLNLRLKEISLQDELTGIANRRLFDVSLSAEWRRAVRAQTPLSMLLGDVDHFKAYNDRYGHQQGDECLKAIAAVIARDVRRAGELIARYGGEEFAVILPGIAEEDALQRANEMRAGVEGLAIRHEGSPVSEVATISFGVACVFPSVEDSSDSLLRNADVALYKAKDEGRNRVVGGA
jgi:diguanylate cyclase (GGDEF)-like protein